MNSADAAVHAVDWQPGPDAEHPYRADVDGAHWLLRLNDFPAEPLFTLVIDGVDVGDLESWPAAWQRPAS